MENAMYERTIDRIPVPFRPSENRLALTACIMPVDDGSLRMVLSS
jgi:hypothetical protein